MAELMTVKQAVECFVHGGHTVALEGFTGRDLSIAARLRRLRSANALTELEALLALEARTGPRPARKRRMTRGIYRCDGIRTPIGRFGGALSAVCADDLAVIPLRALLERNPTLDLAAIDEVFLGCANQAGEDNRNLARMATLLAGLPASVPGVTVNRLCASIMSGALALEG